MFKTILRVLKNKLGSGLARSGIDIFIDENGHIENDVPLNSSEKNILENLLSFRELKVGEVMIPRTDLVGIESGCSFEDVKNHFIKTGFTRMPVYRENLDDIIGFIHIKDFIPYMDGVKSFKINDIIRKIIYAPRSTKCIDLLSHIKSGTTHVAIILDEYGGTEGMVVVENLVERIVGDIRDEHDQATKIFISKISANVYEIDARAAIQDVEEALDLSLSQEDGEYETFGGFVLSYLGRVPCKGEKISHQSGIEIEIVDAEPRKIKSTKVTLAARASI